jgi:putative endonuclease
MKHFVYLIASVKESKIKSYVGYTNNLKKRLVKHNLGKGAKSTRGRIWKFIYFKKYATKQKAMSQEYFLKKDKKKRKSLMFKFLTKNQI